MKMGWFFSERLPREILTQIVTLCCPQGRNIYLQYTCLSTKDGATLIKLPYIPADQNASLSFWISVFFLFFLILQLNIVIRNFLFFPGSVTTKILPFFHFRSLGRIFSFFFGAEKKKCAILWWLFRPTANFFSLQDIFFCEPEQYGKRDDIGNVTKKKTKAMLKFLCFNTKVLKSNWVIAITNTILIPRIP